MAGPRRASSVAARERDELVSTKLTTPRVRPDRVARSRSVEALNNATTRELVLVHARRIRKDGPCWSGSASSIAGRTVAITGSPVAVVTDIRRSGAWRAGCPASGYVRFGGRSEETGRSKGQYLAAGRPDWGHGPRVAGRATLSPTYALTDNVRGCWSSGPGRVAGPGLRLRCGWLRRACPGRGRRAS